MTPAGIPRPPQVPPPATARRQPDQRFHPCTRRGCPRPSSQMRGRASPPGRRGPTPPATLGQLSPGRPELLTSSVERCRGSACPHHAGQARARLHYVEREDPGDGHPATARGTAIVPARHFSMPSARSLAAAHPAPRRATPALAVARTPIHQEVFKNTKSSPVPLDRLRLTLVGRRRSPGTSRWTRCGAASGSRRLGCPAASPRQEAGPTAPASMSSAPCSSSERSTGRSWCCMTWPDSPTPRLRPCCGCPPVRCAGATGSRWRGCGRLCRR